MTTIMTMTIMAAPDGLISAEKAEQAVLNKLPGATIRSMELDEDDGYYCYEGEAYKTRRI